MGLERSMSRAWMAWQRFCRAPLDAVETRRVARLFESARLYGPLLVALLLLGAFAARPYVPDALVIAFVVALLLEALVKISQTLRYDRLTRPPAAAWRFVILGGALYSGLVYGSAALVLLLPVPPDVHLLLGAVYAAVLAWAVLGMSQSLMASVTMSVPIALPMTLMLLASSSTSLRLLGGLVAVSTGVGLYVTARTCAALTRLIELDIEKQQLLTVLERETSHATQARERAEQAVIDKSLFIATASHDLRQPVHALGLFQHALERRCQDADEATLVRAIGESSATLTAMLDGLLDMSHIDARTIEPDWASIDMQEVLDALEREFAPIVAARGLSLHTDVKPVRAWSDRMLLTRVLRNLLSNAVKFSDGGTIALSAESVRGDDGESRLRVRVSDDGRGIAAADIDRVFDAFYRGGARVDSPEPGVGLGLSIVARLCALLDATVDLESEPGRGTSVQIDLPIATPHDDRRGAQAGAMRPDMPPLNGVRVLVIDDDPAIRDGMRSVLEGQGCMVDLAEHGRAARRAVRGFVPDAVLCDYRLGDGPDGLAVLADLRLSIGRPLPAAIISGEPIDPSRLARGTDGNDRDEVLVLRKPVAPPLLFETLERLTRA